MGKEIATQVQETQRVPKRIKPRQNTQFNSVQLLSRVQLFATPWTAAHQASLSITNSHSLLKLMSIESVMPSNHLILCHHQVSKHPRNMVIKLTKIKHKEQILKAAREKQQITHKGIPIRIIADLSIEALQARREWLDILKMMKEKNLQPRILYPARISFGYKGEIKSFTGKQKLREFSTSKPALQQMLKDLL